MSACPSLSLEFVMSFHSILLVEGNLESARRLTAALGALGYHVEVAPNGATALQLARGGRFDIGIFSDSLPDGEGVSFFERVAALQRGMRGVLMTAVGNLTTVWKAVSAGMQRVVMLPVDVELLLNVVESEAAADDAEDAEPVPLRFDEAEIASLRSEDIRHQLSDQELAAIIRSVEYPFAGKDRLEFFDRDTLERVAHMVRRWCQSRRQLSYA
jgi:DNA-binding NtrC family response regulator